MKDKKQQKKPQGKQVKQKIKEAVPLCLSLGKIDLIYRIEFTEKDLENSENPNEKYDIENFNSIKDLQFIKDKKSILEKIQLIPNNSTLEQLIIANKISKKKMHIDYIGYGRPKFEGDEEFFNDIFNYVNDKNHIDINSKPLDESGPYSITFEFFFKDKTHSFSIGTSSGGGEGKKEEKKEEQKEEKKEEKNEEKKEDEDYEENEAMKQGKIPKFSRKDTILSNLYPRYNRYCSFYLNYDELKNIPGNFEKRDLIEFIFFMKKKGTKIFLNFYQPQEEEKKEEEEDESNKNKDNQVAGETYDASGKQNEKAKEQEKQQEEEDEDQESKLEKEMKDLNNLYYLTDLYFFDNKQAISEFDKHYKFFTSDKDKDKKKINKTKLYDYFIKGIASGTKSEVDGDKYGFFLDEFLKYFVVHAAKKNAKKYEFDCQLYPKINHNNMNLIEDYKKIIKKNVNHYISLFITFIISGVTSTGSTSNEVIIGAFLNALEIIKRKLECEKNNVILSEKELMKFKLSEKNLADRINELALGNQESGFILDCTNKEKSELKEYVPLYDYHLVYYFRSDVNKKELQKRGFINEKGIIIYDPVHRKRMRPDLEKKKLSEEETLKKVEGNIKNIDVGSRIKDKEIDSSKIDQKKNMLTVKKLPKSKYGIVKKKDKPKKEKAKKEKTNDADNSGSGSGSGSDSSGEEENKNESQEPAEKSQENNPQQ
jgi:hypothetical protein